MKFLLISLFAISCASFHKERVIETSSIDTLRFETLNRYDEKRLQSILSKVKGLDKNLVECHSGNVDSSLEDLSHKLDDNFQNAKYWNTIAVCYLVKEDFNKAKFYVDKGLSSKRIDKKTKASLLNNLGLIYLKGGMLHEAHTQFTKSQKVQSLLTTKFNLISIYLEFGMMEKAKELIFPLYDMNPQDYDLVFAMGSYYLQLGKYNQALTFFKKLSPENQKRNDVANAMAISYYQLNDFPKAMDILEARHKNLSETHLSSVSIELEKMIKNKMKEVR